MVRTSNGMLNGLIGILIFSASLPATRIAVLELDPVFLTLARAALAGGLAAILLVVLPQKRPARVQFLSLAVVALGVVIGFPLFTALALQHISAAHSTVYIGLLPLATAGFGVLRGGERPNAVFWAFALMGSALVAGFAAVQGWGAASIGDGLMIVAILVCGLGYAEGARLSRALGGWQVICWALVISLPVILPLTWLHVPAMLDEVSWPAWGALAYVSVFSMLVGFVFWYRGLAEGGIASVGQLQLLQPFFGLALSALLLGEQITPAMLLVTSGVILCVAGSRHFGSVRTRPARI